MTECRKPDLKMIDDAASRLYSPAVRRTPQPFTRLLHGLKYRAVQWLKWRATVRELHQLRDRDLRDIGLRRDEIPDVVSYLLDKSKRRWDRGPD
jgi:uncharacterized protein YjiS (DUF1127 family)